VAAHFRNRVSMQPIFPKKLVMGQSIMAPLKKEKKEL
jgi:hypothetical protein